ncbi:MAG: LacI family DNA-binding transcriptional regulator [Phycisphaeraceae bacterium]|nr:LacI family DNA-binding transcriptional regulator [Phycisphaeraceae bacterium]
MTRRELAQMANVTPAVVTAALTGRPQSIRVSDRTADRIRLLAKQHNYQPDIRARALSQGKSMLLAYLSREGAQYWNWHQVQDIQVALRGTDYSVILHHHRGTLEDEAYHVQQALRQRVDGLFVCGGFLSLDGQTNEPLFRHLQDEGVRILQFYNVIPGLVSINHDDRAMSRMATRHLIAQGHRRITFPMYVSCLDQRVPRAFLHLRNQVEGYVEAMGEAGLTTDVWHFEAPATGRSGLNQMIDHGMYVWSQLKQRPGRPTAVLLHHDLQVIGLMRSAMADGIRIPRDLSVMGCCDMDLSQVTSPAVTTISTDDSGMLAGRMMLDMLAGRPVQDVFLEPSVVVRESVAPPPDDPRPLRG